MNAGRGHPALGDTREELLAALRELLHFEVREVFLTTLLSIRDRKGQVKFFLCLDNYLLCYLVEN